MKLSAFLMLGLFAWQLAPAAPLSVRQLQQVLQRENAGWLAEENEFTALSESDKKSLLGLRTFVPEPAPYHPKAEDFDEALPPALDWRQVAGRNYDTPVKSQGKCGSCVAFATMAVVEMQRNISGKNADLDLDFSEQHHFDCGGGSCKTGWWLQSSLLSARERGFPDEQCFPYQSGKSGLNIGCKATCGDAAERLSFIQDFRQITSIAADIPRLKKALNEGPLLTTMRIYEDFYAYKSGVYEHKLGKFLGFHAVAIIGYDSAKRAFLVKNSWSERWGELGYFWIRWGDKSGLGQMSYQAKVAP